MIELNNSSYRFSLKIVDYQFPNSVDDWDANWLSILIKLEDHTNDIHFEFTDPCLLTMEIVDLKNWFLALKDNREKVKIRFMEPELSFSFLDNFLRINLRHRLNPSTYQPVYEIGFSLNNIQIEKVIESIEKKILEYPKKFNPR